MAELPSVVTLVLDDFHLIQDRLVLATRADPALRLQRLRVNGDVTDIRANDLAFTEAEAAELFDRSGLHLAGPLLGVLLDRTEGWAAGLRLAIMCLDPADIDDGISRFEVILGRLPDADRRSSAA